jgi:hypothetical protein
MFEVHVKGRHSLSRLLIFSGGHSQHWNSVRRTTRPELRTWANGRPLSNGTRVQEAELDAPRYHI